MTEPMALVAALLQWGQEGVGGRVEGPMDAHGRWALARTEGLAETL